MGLIKDMRIVIAKVLWPLVKYDGLVTNNHHFCGGVSMTICGGEVVNHFSNNVDLTSCHYLEHIVDKLNSAFCLTGVDIGFNGVDDEFYPHLKLNDVLLQEVNNNKAVKSIIYTHSFDYRIATEGEDLILISRVRICNCSTREHFTFSKLETLGDAMRFCGFNYPDHVSLSLRFKHYTDLSIQQHTCMHPLHGDILKVVHDNVKYLAVDFSR